MMEQVWNSLVGDHDLRMVLLAVAVCAFGASATMNILGRITGRQRARLWHVLLSLCAGATVWATHFIAMLAYQKSIPTTYDMGLTVLSLCSGIALMGLGFWIALRGSRVIRMRAVGGAIVGLGVVVLHYVGMAAVRMPAALSYAPGIVTTSVVFALGFGALALVVALEPKRPWALTSGGVLMIAMIATLHFTAMGAVHVEHGMMGHGVGEVSRSVLAIAVAVASFAVLLIGMAGAMVDQRVSERLAADADRFRALSDGAFEGVVVHRDGTILDANEAARRMLQIPEGAAVLIDDCFPKCPASRWAQRREPDATPVEVEMRRADGSTFPAEISRRRMLLKDGSEGELIALRDVTARKESEARIAHLALHDPVTELPNRRLFIELGHKAVSVAQRGNERLAVLALDIDDFKVVNDMYGHDAGDAVLRAVSARISETLREADVCARFGGDEFTVLQTTISQPAQTIGLVERLLHALQAPVLWQGTQIAVGVSIGVSVFPEDGTTLEQLLRNADTAMYRAKAGGKRTSRFFEPQMDAALVARHRIEARLRLALAEGSLDLDFQPLVAAGDGAPVAFEALLRWNDAELGQVEPAAFIPVAEETGMIVAIGEFVLRRACAAAMRWPDHLRVAVNLSAVQFRRRELVQSVRLALLESGLPGHRLELEITETLLIENREDALRQLEALRGLGIHIAMDDFGTGYSSLSYLQSFPFDTLKIDRVFVSKLAEDSQSVAIVQAMVSMGRSLGMRVVAEGVETEVQAELLRRLECDDLQGFLVARPMAADRVAAFLDETAGVTERGSTLRCLVLAGGTAHRRGDVIPMSATSAAFLSDLSRQQA